MEPGKGFVAHPATVVEAVHDLVLDHAEGGDVLCKTATLSGTAFRVRKAACSGGRVYFRVFVSYSMNLPTTMPPSHSRTYRSSRVASSAIS